MKAQATQRINMMFERFQLEGEEIDRFNQQAVLLLGNSGAGKTTSSYFLMNKELVGAYQNGQIVYKYKQKHLNAEIGHTNNYCTQKPNIFQQQYGCLVDCPYFLDSYKFDRYMMNVYYMHRIFSNSKKLKFIFTCNEEALTANRARLFLVSFNYFLNLFNFNQQFTAKELAKSTVLLITKSYFMDINSISQVLKMLINNPPNDLFQENKQTHCVEILQYWINNKNIFFIKRAENDTPSPKNILLKEIHDKTEYWKRKVGNDGIIEMDHVHFQINQKNMEPDEVALTENAFDVCCGTLENLSRVLAEALLQIQQNILKDDYRYKFYDQWRSQIKKIVSFKEKEVDYSKLTRYKQNHLRRIKMIQLAYQLAISSFSEKKRLEDISIVTKISMNQLLESIIQYITDTPDEQKIVSQFSYIVNRKFEEIKILQKLSNNFGRLGRNSLIQLMGFTYLQYSQIEKNFSLNYELKQNKPAAYYTQLIEFLNKYKDQKLVLKKIYKAQCISGNYAYNEKNKQQALIYYISAVKHLEILNQDENKGYYVKIDKSLYRKVADVFFEMENYEHALKFYIVINEVTKIKICYDEIFKVLQKQENKISNRKQKGDYFREMTLFVSAVRSYHQALSIASQQAQYLEINNRIIQTHQKRDQYIKQLKQKYERKQYYRRLETNFNFDQAISELKKKSSRF